jgi:hypothetical protein
VTYSLAGKDVSRGHCHCYDSLSGTTSEDRRLYVCCSYRSKPVRLLRLLVVTGSVYKCSVNQITNANPVYGHSYTWQHYRKNALGRESDDRLRLPLVHVRFQIPLFDISKIAERLARSRKHRTTLEIFLHRTSRLDSRRLQFDLSECVRLAPKCVCVDIWYSVMWFSSDLVARRAKWFLKVTVGKDKVTVISGLTFYFSLSYFLHIFPYFREISTRFCFI